MKVPLDGPAGMARAAVAIGRSRAANYVLRARQRPHRDHRRAAGHRPQRRALQCGHQIGRAHRKARHSPPCNLGLPIYWRIRLEQRRAGQNAPQGWEFYAITGTLFVTLAFPGFIYRYLVRRRG